MAFLDNSGDIILDAVLTDTGRFRLAKGDGSFKVTKFALGDDEIDYGTYDRNNPSGSAFFDLEILQTPVLEAFTDNAASLKSKLISIPRTNLLYLPVIKLNDLFEKTALNPSGAFFVAVDKDTEDTVSVVNNQLVDGIILGETLEGGSYIRCDQGLDTTEITPSVTIDSDLVETQYIVEIDNRLGKIASRVNGRTAKVSFIDDDNMASYFFSLGTDLDYVLENEERERKQTQVIDGPRGTVLQFTIQSSLELNTSDFLFEQLGNPTTIAPNQTAINKIDTIVRVTGATTGYRLDIPVRFIKLA
jgi:hypothetical protein